MKVALAADHAGFELKQMLAGHVRSLGHEVLDAGAYSCNDADDYPDFAQAIADVILNGKADRGILICGSGVGASVAANKVPGIRAAVCHDEYSAHQGVEHDDMNVLVLGSRVIGVALARELVERFLAARFTNEERHARRLSKVQDIERRYNR
jgi:ribose 5-phosphate isomerase B